MAKEIIWSTRARNELSEILNYWDERNQSPAYSEKLLERIINIGSAVGTQNYLGRQTSIANVRVTGFEAYLVFYEILENHILILSVFDGRRNPQKQYSQ